MTQEEIKKRNQALNLYLNKFCKATATLQLAGMDIVFTIPDNRALEQEVRDQIEVVKKSFETFVEAQRAQERQEDAEREEHA